MNNQKQIVTRWYGAFEKNNPTILDEVLAKDWRDIPPAPAQPPGPEGAKQILVELWTTFPDLSIKIEDVLQDGNKVVVRSTISGTQKGPFLGYPPKNRKMARYLPRIPIWWNPVIQSSVWRLGGRRLRWLLPIALKIPA
jgi:predicted ester cyclase